MIYLGLDLGKMRDFTALAAVERGTRGELAVRYLERMSLGTPYTRVVERVAEVSRDRVLNGYCHLTFDGSGSGIPVEEMLRAVGTEAGWRGMTAVTITGGDTMRQASGYGMGERWNVPRRDLLSGVQVLLEKGELKIAGRLKESRALVRELVRMRRRGPGGEGPEEEHDDLAMAVALACWQATRPKVGLGFGRVI